MDADALAARLQQLRPTVTVVRKHPFTPGTALSAVMVPPQCKQGLTGPLPTAPSNVKTREIKAAYFETNMEEWVGKLKEDETIPTRIRKLSVAEGQALLSCNLHAFNPQPKSAYAEVFARLEGEVNALLSSCHPPGQQNLGGFVKLSCRSPKDVLDPEKVARLFHEVIKDSPKYADPVVRLEAMYLARIGQMRVFTGAEAIDLLLKSERISFDLGLDLKFPDEFATSLIVRPWLNIPLWGEFRAWVHGSELTGISQYYTSFQFEQLSGDPFLYPTSPKGQVLAKLTGLFDKVKDRLSDYHKYVIDFAITGDGRPLVLELNPYLPSTGACLFDWETDAEVLANGPLQFRTTRQLNLDEIKAGLAPEWVAIIFNVENPMAVLTRTNRG